jgi:hypothetical protein
LPNKALSLRNQDVSIGVSFNLAMGRCAVFDTAAGMAARGLNECKTIVIVDADGLAARNAFALLRIMWWIISSNHICRGWSIGRRTNYRLGIAGSIVFGIGGAAISRITISYTFNVINVRHVGASASLSRHIPACVDAAINCL